MPQYKINILQRTIKSIINKGKEYGTTATSDSLMNSPRGLKKSGHPQSKSQCVKLLLLPLLLMSRFLGFFWT